MLLSPALKLRGSLPCRRRRPKSKPVKRAVHIPCWESCKFNPLKWRGIVLGRTCRQCYWAGMHETRWSRSTYSGALGRCYNLPIKNIAKSDTAFLSNTMCLCALEVGNGNRDSVVCASLCWLQVYFAGDMQLRSRGSMDFAAIASWAVGGIIGSRTAAHAMPCLCH